ncbi:hypothetical protein RhiJN_14574 [Ceratobasidium sp. AG-Ba]|nr:hypothetical protein RhiJN_14574 [Ceratobasidium sp. AG-Ba]
MGEARAGETFAPALRSLYKQPKYHFCSSTVSKHLPELQMNAEVEGLGPLYAHDLLASVAQYPSPFQSPQQPMEGLLDRSYINDEEWYCALENFGPLSRPTSYGDRATSGWSAEPPSPTVKLEPVSEDEDDPAPHQLYQPIQEIHPVYLLQPCTPGFPPPPHTFSSFDEYQWALNSHARVILAALSDSPRTVNPADLQLSPYHASVVKDEVPQSATSLANILESPMRSKESLDQSEVLNPSQTRFIFAPKAEEDVGSSTATGSSGSGGFQPEMGQLCWTDPATKECYCLIPNCSRCSKNLAVRGKYSRLYEWERAHGKKDYRCKYCVDVKYTRKSTLKKHIRKCHLQT